MSDEQIKQAMKRIAENDIGDDMNRWEDIYRKLDVPKPRAVRQLSRLAAMVAVTALGLVLTGLSAYAFYRYAQSDGGLNAVDDAGLAQEINISQTIDGITVTVERAYIDSNRFAVWFNVVGFDIPADSTILSGLYNHEVTYADGNGFAQMVGAGGSSGSSEWVDGVMYNVLTINHTEPLPPDGVFELVFTLKPPNEPPYIIPAGVEFEGAIPEEYRTGVMLPDSFSFDLSLRASAPIELEPALTVTANDVAMTLEYVAVAASSTVIQVCYDLPTPQDWQPRLTLRFDDGEPVTLSASGIVGGKEAVADNPRCIRGESPIPYLVPAETITVEVNALLTSRPEDISPIREAAEAWLAERGIVVEFVMAERGFSLDLIERPDGMSDEELYLLIDESLRERYDGPWVFTVPLSE